MLSMCTLFERATRNPCGQDNMISLVINLTVDGAGSFGINNFYTYPLRTTSIVSYLRCVASGLWWSAVVGGRWLGS